MRLATLKSWPKGFTLTELLAVIAIIVLIAVIALPALNLFQSQASVKSSARRIQSILEEARGMAIATGNDHTVRFNVSEGSAVILTANNPVSKTWLAPASIKITDVSIPDPKECTFKSNGGTTGVSFSVYLTRRAVSDTDTDISKFYTVKVDNTTGVAQLYPRKEN